jgi:hypothetical protein
MQSNLLPATSLGASITAPEPGIWRLTIPPGPRGSYRLAQLSDYSHQKRADFSWRPPRTIRLEARISHSNLPGTWGFGLWNDPFSLSVGFGGGTRRFPAGPNAAWFFYASPENDLSFRNDKPAHGFLAQTFRSPQIPTPLLALGALGLPLFAWPGLARQLRSGLSNIISEDSHTGLRHTPVGHPSAELEWHQYQIQWVRDRVTFQVDDQTFETPLTPNGPLGLVIWIDNQFAAFPPDGRLSYGTLPFSEAAWLEIRNCEC